MLMCFPPFFILGHLIMGVLSPTTTSCFRFFEISLFKSRCSCAKNTLKSSVKVIKEVPKGKFCVLQEIAKHDLFGLKTVTF